MDGRVEDAGVRRASGGRWGAWGRRLLGGLALASGLTAGWASVPSPLEAQGWIEPPAIVNGGAVEKIRSQVEVRIDGRVARVEVTEWFRNRGGRVAEGHYLYPLPGEAVFQGFSLFQGETELRGEVMDAGKARAIYEEIVRRRADPALLELAGQGLIRARVFPIEPGDERKVTLRYTQLLDRAGNALQLRYAAGARGAVDRPLGPTDEIRPMRGRDDAVDTRFHIVVETPGAFLDPFSPTHALAVERTAERLEIDVEDPLEDRFSLFLPLAEADVALSLATHRPAGEDGYFMLTLSPGRTVARPQPRDVTVVLDVSGSMSGEEIEQARAALHTLLGTLSRDDRFRLLTFSNAVRRFRSEWSVADEATLDDARAWVDRIGADGGTNIEAALEEAFGVESDGERLPMVLFLTDGLPSVGEQSPERLADRAEARAGRARVFAFGVGPDVNTHLLDRLGEAGRGSTEYVEPGEDVERAVGLLAARIRHPVLTDLEIDGAPVRFSEIHPVRLPDLFDGEELVLFGRYRGEGDGEVRIRGVRAGRTETFQAEGSFPARTEANDFIPRLWASRKLGHLTRQIWTEGETPGLVEEIRAVALRYGLPSRYTSYLVTEPGAVVADRDAAMPALRQDVAAAPMSPTSATGAGAVREAEEAQRLRRASSARMLDDAEADLQASVAKTAEGREVRAVAGRVLARLDGVWTDQTPSRTQEETIIEPFSDAYFALLREMPELRPVASLEGAVVVHGRALNLRFEAGGRSRVDGGDLRDMVVRFREAPAR